MTRPSYQQLEERLRTLEEAEKQHRLESTYFERLFNSAPEAIALHDSNDRIVNINEEFTRMFGYTRDEAIGQPINDLIVSPEYFEEATAISRDVIHGMPVERETRRKRKDGTLIDVSILGAPIFHEGHQVGDYAIYRNITERKRTEEELRLQKSFFEQLFNNAPEAIVLHDSDDRVVNVNMEFTRLFGYTRDEAIGRQVNDLVAPPDLTGEAAHYSRTVIDGDRVEAESLRKRKDGTLIDVSILGAPIVHRGQQVGVYAIYRDITEKKKAEEARIQAREEARMARNIQMNFLPDANPIIPGYDIAGKSVPAMVVGGDYYDFIALDEHRLAIGLGDVSGNGLAASLVMANLQATIRAQVLFDPDPRKCLERSNTLLYRSTDARTFVSLFFGILDTRTNVLTYANAGQNPPVYFPSTGSALSFTTRGMALGITEHVEYESAAITFQSGDQLLLHSDGMQDAIDVHMEEFGSQRIRETVEREHGLNAAGIVERLFAAVGRHVGTAGQSDDMTAVLLRRLP